MAITEVKKIHTAKKPDGNYIEDPKIVKVAKLVLILASDEVDIEEKRLCLTRFRPNDGTPLFAEFSVDGRTVLTCTFLNDD